MKYTGKLIEYGLYLLAFLLPIQARWIIRDTGLEYTTISFYGTDILLIILLALFIVWKIKKKNYQLSIINYQFWNPWSFILLIDTAAFISIFFATDKWLAFAIYTRLLLALGLFWIVVNASYDKIKLGYFFVGGLLLQSFLAIWQFLSQSTFSSKWLGIASHDAYGLAGESVIEASGGRWLRAYGGLDHPNVLGGALAICIIAMTVFILDKIRKEWMVGDWREKIKTVSILAVSKKIFIFYASLLVMLAALFFTFSRSSWLALAVAVFSISFYFIFKGNKEEKFVYGKIMMAMFFAFFALNLIYGGLVGTRTDFGNRLESKSISERTRYYGDFKSIIGDNWLFGVGIGNYSMAIENKFSGRPVYDYQPVHNAFLLIWSEIGTLGVLGMLGLIIYLIMINYKSNILNLFIFLSFIVLLLLDHWLWSLHFGVYFIFFVFGYYYQRTGVIIAGDKP